MRLTRASGKAEFFGALLVVVGVGVGVRGVAPGFFVLLHGLRVERLGGVLVNLMDDGGGGGGG